ncbi:MAG: hypothetical protein ACYSWO_28370 [Planctomycetota bacterium]|jgi:hypothetical protein
MKIGGVEVKGPSEEVLVLPRPTGQDIVIRAQAVMDMTPFDSMCPEPKAKPVLVAGGFKPNEKDPNYLAAIQKHGEMRFAYIALKSLEPSKIEWERADLGNPASWLEWEKELGEAGFSRIEINRIIMCIMSANSLDDEKLEKARESFLLGLADAEEKSSGPRTEPPSSSSGEPVNASE